jgi:hypothetical protein
MGEIGNESKVLIGKDEGKRQFGRPRRRLKDNIKMNVKEIWRVCELDSSGSGRNMCQAFVNTTMNLRFP